MSQPRRLFFIYLSALAVLLGSILATMVFTEMDTFRLARDAKAINVSGRQRMLSQRIAYLAQELHLKSREDTRRELLAVTAEFEASINLFANAHTRLSSISELTPFYFSGSDELSLDARVRRYVTLAREIAADPARRDGLEELKDLERRNLLRDLDAVVSAIEGQSVERMSLLRAFGRGSIGIALTIVVVEILFVFRPGHRYMERLIGDLKSSNADLFAAEAKLRAANDALSRKSETILEDRARLQQALSESEALRKEQSAFTYAISHDLKSPANTLQLLLDELARASPETLDDDTRALLAEGRLTVQRMHEQVEDVLAYATVIGRPSAPEVIDVTELVDELRLDLEGDIAARRPIIALGPVVPLFGFRTQIRCLLRNLILNAVKYCAADIQPEITVSSADLTTGYGTSLTVKDNGIGIAPEHHAQIFGLFQRLHLRSEYPGTGLGLSTCARVAANHNGDITVASDIGKGAVFTVTLRLPRPGDTPREAAA